MKGELLTYANEFWKGMLKTNDSEMETQLNWKNYEDEKMNRPFYKENFNYNNGYSMMYQTQNKYQNNHPQDLPYLQKIYPGKQSPDYGKRKLYSSISPTRYHQYESTPYTTDVYSRLSPKRHFIERPTTILQLTTPGQYKQYDTSPPIMKRPKYNFTSEDTLKRPQYNFTSEDVNTVLYGYIKDDTNSKTLLHSLSGLSNHSAIEENPTALSSLQLPSSLVIDSARMGNIYHTGVFSKTAIAKGKRFGPYTGTFMKSNDVKQKCNFCWEIFQQNDEFKIIDGSTHAQNWMKYVNTARYQAEQNLSIIQIDSELYYEVAIDIPAGKELLVWYGEEHVTFMDIPCAYKPTVTSPIKIKENVKLKDAVCGNFPCARCGKIFSYEYYRDKHLKYTRCVDMGDRKFPCHLCQRSFEKKDRLRIHILHVHQKYRPHVCKVCGKRFSQSSSLNKHSRVHTGERPYQCPHCPKSFTASSILRTHLRQHNGERPFKCKFCSKAFASHAAHDSHVRRTHEQLKTCLCKICNKSFSMEFELKFHLSTHTTEELNSVGETTYGNYKQASVNSDMIVVDM